MKKFPVLLTKRLRLRRLELSDLQTLIRFANNRKISDQILNIPFPYREEDAIQRFNFILQGFRNGERYVFAITLRGKENLIGEIGIHLDKENNHAQFGYWVAEPYWGKGIATEATGAILKFGFEKLGLRKIYATHYLENPASGKVMSNNGMIVEGELKDHYRIGNSYRSVVQFRLTSDEYKKQRTK
jgi:[ribosomal protein S5]-alanine N-acetyltransferase